MAKVPWKRAGGTRRIREFVEHAPPDNEPVQSANWQDRGNQASCPFWSTKHARATAIQLPQPEVVPRLTGVAGGPEELEEIWLAVLRVLFHADPAVCK
jgi:hypothetical protein